MYLKVNINHMVNECIIFTILSTNIHAPSTLVNLQRVVIYHSGVNIGRNIWETILQLISNHPILFNMIQE